MITATPPRPVPTTALVVVGGVLATFVSAAGFVLSPLLVLAVLVGALLAAAAAARPVAAATIAVVGIAALPVYWGRGLSGFGLALVPATIAAAVLAPAAVRSMPAVRPVFLDGLVLAYVVLRSTAYVLNLPGGIGSAVSIASRVLPLYAVFRILSIHPGIRRRMATALVATGAALALTGWAERGAGNPFFSLLPPGYQAAAWARPELRFGAVRVEASFGHPIAFGLFLAFALTIGVALALTGSARRRGAQLFLAAGAAVLMAVALLDTLSRGPILVAVLAPVLWALREHRRVTPGRVVLVGVGLTMMLVLTPALTTLEALWTSSRGDTKEARSAEYRVDVAALLVDPEQRSLLGKPTERAPEGAVAAVSRRVGFKSLDNEYALVYVAGGALSLLAFVAITGSVIRTALRPRIDPVDRAWLAALAVTGLALTTVALLTQFADLFWISVAVAATVRQEGVSP